ncbi:hypothetical protein ACQR1V_02595 [Bradyrhizobium oligotrophicum]|uniref:hypothetical protein n=1 Tax=Bradyrhizobium oligotrophicum TaxID=44255 RepID=UPI003EBCD4CE
MATGKRPLCPRAAWIWLRSEAAYRPRTVPVRNGRRTTLLSLDVGQLSHSQSFLADAWGWTAKAVRTFLEQIERAGLITTRPGSQTGQFQTVITICDYNGNPQLADSPQEGQGQSRAVKLEKKGSQTGSQTGRVTNCDQKEIGDDISRGAVKRAVTPPFQGQQEERNTSKRKDILPSTGEGMSAGFAEWYGVFPRKVARIDAERAYAKAITSGRVTHERLMERTRRFAELERAKPIRPGDRRFQFTPYPASWLNGGQYDDEDLQGSAVASDALPDPRSFTDDDWRGHLKIVAKFGEWSEAWGPRPGQPGCLVPPALLLSPVDAIGKAPRTAKVVA